MRPTSSSPQPATHNRHPQRFIALISAVACAGLCIWLTWWFTKHFAVFKHSPEAFKTFIESYGWTGRFVALGIQILQVVLSLIPGELVEVSIGYTFGAVEGTLLCMLGVAIASSLVFLLVKHIGIRLVELFVSRQKIDQLRFINSETKLKRLLFILFFIPGTPKDLLTYFAGLTRIKLHEFLIITLLARIPSLASSTIGGNLIQQQAYGQAILLFAITGFVSLVGILGYNRIVKNHNTKNENKSPDI